MYRELSQIVRDQLQSLGTAPRALLRGQRDLGVHFASCLFDGLGEHRYVLMGVLDIVERGLAIITHAAHLSPRLPPTVRRVFLIFLNSRMKRYHEINSFVT